MGYVGDNSFPRAGGARLRAMNVSINADRTNFKIKKARDVMRLSSYRPSTG